MGRWLGPSTSARIGALLLLFGATLLGFALLWQLGWVPGSRVTLPEPVALQRSGTEVRQVQAAPTPAPTAVPTPAPTIAPTPLPIVAAAAPPTPDVPPRTEPLVAADHGDRKELELQPPPGYAVRLAIPAIKLDTPVEQGGTTQNGAGDLEWVTLPFVAVHYGDLTSLVGASGNAVIAGHVVTLNEGNVFRFLYQVDLDDEVQVWDNHDQVHAYRVAEVKLVPPTDVSVMEPTADQRLTLITCGGTFDPIKREFSDRLIVVAMPLG